jgi:putative transposase
MNRYLRRGAAASNIRFFWATTTFVSRMLAKASPARKQAKEVPRAQRKLPITLAAFVEAHQDRDAALHAAYKTAGLTMTQIAAERGLSVSRVSRVIAAVELTRSKAKGKA